MQIAGLACVNWYLFFGIVHVRCGLWAGQRLARFHRLCRNPMLEADSGTLSSLTWG
jgi:hypothetical protein